ncbi:MAG: Uma2 family endonuclease [Bacteroidota bacterium]
MEVLQRLEDLDRSKTYSYLDYLTWHFQERVELIKGKIFTMSPAPGRRHQQISVELSRQFANFLLNHRCEVYEAPFDIRLPRIDENEIYTVVQPDLVVICDQSKLDDAGCLGAPDLIVEILSKSTLHKDLKDKFELYEESGVLEYWIISPNDEVVDVFVLDKDSYHLVGKYTVQDEVQSLTLKGLSVDLSTVFRT